MHFIPSRYVQLQHVEIFYYYFVVVIIIVSLKNIAIYNKTTVSQPYSYNIETR